VLDSLHRRPRGAALAGVLARLTGGLVPTGPQAPRAERIVAALAAYRVPEYDQGAGPATRGLLVRLGDADVAEVLRGLEPDLQAIWDTAHPGARERLKLIFGVHRGIAGVLERTGLRTDVPPEDVHAMGRGALAAGGDFWLADFVADAAQRSGVELADGTRVLDFGCSSGRHLRVLQAWRPQVGWTGCDPNERAIRWAGEHLPGIEFFASPQEPPLDMPSGSLDVVFAVSVWSHFGAGAAERWLAEMHRLLRPGGVLVLTVQGFGSLAHYLRGGKVGAEYATRAAEDLLASGHHYVDAFGPAGDWGVKSAEWGMAFMTLEWLAERALPDWEVALYEPVRVDANQDLVTLRRR
jgi:SAM-dependent methyltransferase